MDDPPVHAAIIVRPDQLHVADSANPERQCWEYDDETVRALVRHLEVLAPGSIRVGLFEEAAGGGRLLRALVEAEMPLLVLEGTADTRIVREPCDLLGDLPGGLDETEEIEHLPDAVVADLRGVSRRIDQLAEMRVSEAERADRVSDAEIAGSIAEHLTWLKDRERRLRERFTGRLRASRCWRTVPSESRSD